MGFSSYLETLERQGLEGAIGLSRPDKVHRALAMESLSPDDFAALLSPAAVPFLESMAEKAQELTRLHFGRTLQFFTPMYLSNFCTNQCLYCGFSARMDIARQRMTMEEVRKEAEEIAGSGIRHILVLTGDDRRRASVQYIARCCGILRDFFSSISVEVFAMHREEYQVLVAAGADGLTIYQETYNRGLYSRIHPRGPKADFDFRLEAPARGALAGMRTVGIGALLGLDSWQREIFTTGLHARWLERTFPSTEFSISLPRIRPHGGCYQPSCTVSDRDMVQMLAALRIFLPRCGITLSTRESEGFRNNIMGLGVTRMSAGTTTAVGGHTASGDRAGQFAISDTRSVREMVIAVRQRGLQPVFKDWQRC